MRHHCHASLGRFPKKATTAKDYGMGYKTLEFEASNSKPATRSQQLDACSFYAARLLNFFAKTQGFGKRDNAHGSRANTRVALTGVDCTVNA
jgi:hypothetical protein